MKWVWFGAYALALAAFAVICAHACNEAVCASLVSKCMLLKSCECNMLDKKNCTCCRDCHRCLAKLYTECCSCVGMCESPHRKHNSAASARTSSIEALDTPIPELFRVITAGEPGEALPFTTYTYPAHLDLLYFKPRGSQEFASNVQSVLEEGEPPHRVRHGHSHILIDPDTDAHNCTVAYMSDCMSLNKCRQTCDSMGAARLRWFHEFGCCECIDASCLDYGKGEALCAKCSAAAFETASETSEEEALGHVVGENFADMEDDEIEQEAGRVPPPAEQLRVAEEHVIQRDARKDKSKKHRDRRVLSAADDVNAVGSPDDL